MSFAQQRIWPATSVMSAMNETSITYSVCFDSGQHYDICIQ